ncbi:MAG: 50S ribosomal protein L11 methyltransferase [Steroidobacteraceae bacterium]
MPFHQLVIELGCSDPGAAEHACLALGAIAISLSDGGNQPLLEPGPGETPLWSEVRLRALYAAEARPDLLAATLAAVLGLPARSISAEPVDHRAWEREWLVDFRPMRFGKRLWICPGGLAAPDPGAVVLMLDPGLAFGTGTHATTAMCLEWLDSNELAGARVLDYGCGSGILALAALKLGAAAATALDIDPQALIATRDNAAKNGLEARLTIAHAEGAIVGPCDVVLANILAEPLLRLAPAFSAFCRPGGSLLLSGLLESQAAEVAAAYGPWFDVETAARRDAWAMLAGRRRAE